MNRSSLLPRLLFSLVISLPAVARADSDAAKDSDCGGLPACDLAAAETALQAVPATSRKNLKLLKGAKDHPKSALTYPYGAEPVDISETPALAELKGDVKAKRDYWNAVLDIMLKERERINAELDKSDKSSPQHLDQIKALGRLMSKFSVARSIADDIRSDSDLLEVWGQEAGGAQVVGGESVGDMLKRKAALSSSLLASTSDKK